MADEIKNQDNAKEPKGADKQENKWHLAKVTKLFWVALAILAVLLVLSIVILSTRMYKYAKLSDDGGTIKISSDTVRTLDLFSAEYKNGKGEIVVKSADGTPVVAPGTSSQYTFSVKNEDQDALNYSFTPVVEYTGEMKIPLEVKLLGPDDKYLVGGLDSWGTFDDFAKLEAFSGTLTKGEIKSYELEWRWLYERGDDEGDTALGNAADGAAGLNVGLDLYSETNVDYAGGGFFAHVNFTDLLWMLIFFLLLLIAIILLVLSIIRKKAEEPNVVYVTKYASAPEPVAVSTPVPKVNNKKKPKGFVGKMEYVNIDTLVDVFDNGDKITLNILKEKGLVDPEATQVKILARNDMVLNKAFHIETQGISGQARQKVLAAGGSIKIIDG